MSAAWQIPRPTHLLPFQKPTKTDRIDCAQAEEMLSLSSFESFLFDLACLRVMAILNLLRRKFRQATQPVAPHSYICAIEATYRKDMPIAPPPKRLCCKHCGWSTVEAFKSDCLPCLPIDQCPRCGDHPLDRKPLTALGTFILRNLRKFTP